MSETVGTRAATHRTSEYETFVATHRRALERALVARYGVEVGLDATSEALAYAWTEWDRVSTMAQPAGYLYRVGQTQARRRHRWRRALDLPAESSPPADTITRLHDALLRLPPDHRVAVVLVYSHKYSYEEAAEILDIRVSTIRNHLHRGITRLRRLLEEPT